MDVGTNNTMSGQYSFTTRPIDSDVLHPRFISQPAPAIAMSMLDSFVSALLYLYL